MIKKRDNKQIMKATIEIVLLIGMTFASAYFVAEDFDDNTVSAFSLQDGMQYAQQAMQIVKSFGGAFGGGGGLSSEDAKVDTCPESKDGAVCQEYQKDICSSICKTSCLSGSRDSLPSESECTLGTCIDSERGTCMPSSPKNTCNETGMEWKSEKMENIPECTRHCCLLNDELEFLNEKECHYEGKSLGITESFIPELNTWTECYLRGVQKIEGACVIKNGDSKNDCRRTTQKECKEMVGDGGNFYVGLLCSNPSLNTTCIGKNYTSCAENLDEVYWFDSCGNRENVYDGARADEGWNNGIFLSAVETCAIGEIGDSIKNYEKCGNCNRLLGSVCGNESEAHKLNPNPAGDAVCQDLGCWQDMGGGTKQRRENGETWCEYQSNFGALAKIPGLGALSGCMGGGLGGISKFAGIGQRGMDPPGSRYFRQACIDGKITEVEQCDDLRNQICVEHREPVEGTAKYFSTASCRLNRWQECLNYNKKDTGKGIAGKIEGCLNLAKCDLDPDCYVATADIGDQFKFPLCVPKYPPGFDLSGGGGENVCKFASQTCVATFIKEENTPFTMGLAAKWKCKQNCDCVQGEEPESAQPSMKFATEMERMCNNLGDCGNKANYNGTPGMPDFRTLTRCDGESAEKCDSKKPAFSPGLFTGAIFGVASVNPIPGKYIDADQTGLNDVLSKGGSNGGGSGLSGLFGGSGESGESAAPIGSSTYKAYDPGDALLASNIAVGGAALSAYAYAQTGGFGKAAVAAGSAASASSSSAAASQAALTAESPVAVGSIGGELPVAGVSGEVGGAEAISGFTLSDAELNQFTSDGIYNQFLGGEKYAHWEMGIDGKPYVTQILGPDSKPIESVMTINPSITDVAGAALKGGSAITQSVGVTAPEFLPPLTIADPGYLANLPPAQFMQEIDSGFGVLPLDGSGALASGEVAPASSWSPGAVNIPYTQAFSSAMIGASIGMTVASLMIQFSGIGAGMGPAATFTLMGSGAVAGGSIAAGMYFSSQAATASTIAASQAAAGEVVGAQVASQIASKLAGIAAPLQMFGIGLAVLTVADIIGKWIAGVGEIRYVHVSYDCKPWKAPMGGNCEACGEGNFTCSKYACEALGQTCEFVANEPSAICVNVNPHDVIGPKMTGTIESELKEGFEYRDFSEDSFKTSKKDGTCISQFETLKFGFTLDEYGICRISGKANTKFDEMAIDILGGRKSKNMTFEFSYGYMTMLEIEAPPSEKDTDINLYVKCKDVSGNEGKEFNVKFCMKPRDMTSPLLTGEKPNEEYVAYEVTEQEVIVSSTEEVEMRWSNEDEDFDDMENKFDCGDVLGTWKCVAKVPVGENGIDICIKSKDHPEWAGTDREKDRNENIECLPLVVKKTDEPLKIRYVKPEDKSTFTTGPLSYALDVEVGTSGGLQDSASCYMESEGASDLLNTKGNGIFGKTYSSYKPGSYVMNFRCEDSVGNKAVNSTSFVINKDGDAPKIVRMYRENEKIIVITNEPAACAFVNEAPAGKNEPCSFDFDNASLMGTAYELSDYVHETSLDIRKTYYVRCKDNYGNAAGGCNEILRGGEL